MTQRVPSVISEYEDTRILKHGDEYYWQSKTDEKEYGPFSSLQEAVEDMQFQEESLEPGETLTEAEDEIGIADWVDPETKSLAEEHIPRLDEQ